MTHSAITRLTLLSGVVLLAAVPYFMNAQPPFAAPGGPPLPAKTIAPEDLTGYWVSMVTEDWRYRMLTPPKGDYASIPLNVAGRRLADSWDPDKDTAAGEACRSYGAAGLMRVPGRLHITWRDDNTLKIETDAGTQTRLFYFNGEPPAGAAPSWQGYSVASWDLPPVGRGPGGPGGLMGGAGRGGPPTPVTGARNQRAGSLKVVTTHLKPGYLRKNGVPYGANTTLTEYLSRVNDDDGTSWLIVTTIVDDPEYLAQPFMTSTNFKLQADDKGWSPEPCTAK
jgi:hypothetical protein